MCAAIKARINVCCCRQQLIAPRGSTTSELIQEDCIKCSCILTSVILPLYIPVETVVMINKLHLTKEDFERRQSNRWLNCKLYSYITQGLLVTPNSALDLIRISAFFNLISLLSEEQVQAQYLCGYTHIWQHLNLLDFAHPI